MLLSRTADSLYWGARYLERAEDTARLVRSYTELVIDLPTSAVSTWEPLLAVSGSSESFHQLHEVDSGSAEVPIVRFLLADTHHPASIASSVEQARENLRTTREIIPREAWQTVNDLYLYVGSNASSGVERRSRARFLGHLIAECQQLDGVLTTVMNRDEAYELWRLGQSIERADMTTRVVGVRAAALLFAEQQAARDGEAMADIHDDVQWMGLLRSVSALQMYQRATRGPIDGAAAVRFLLLDAAFPRSVASCASRIREALSRLPRSMRTLPAVDELDAVLARSTTGGDDGAALDAAMDEVQLALAAVNDVVHDAFVQSSV
ncbi:MAG: alpha-E domain-containing protein [Ilumatobacteraceae bacterium]|nr:alpha-E domain-containing protein [Acidimicrobiales bacterium]MCB9393036.1 alpha-E domain-containing protein [Acidimicrobiaceae bacterium]